MEGFRYPLPWTCVLKTCVCLLTAVKILITNPEKHILCFEAYLSVCVCVCVCVVIVLISWAVFLSIRINNLCFLALFFRILLFCILNLISIPTSKLIKLNNNYRRYPQFLYVCVYVYHDHLFCGGVGHLA